MFAGNMNPNLSVHITISGQEWSARVKMMEELEQENAYLRSCLKSGNDLIDQAKSFTYNLGAVSRLRKTLEYLERMLYENHESSQGHLLYYDDAFENRKHKWKSILLYSLDEHAKTIARIMRQKVDERTKIKYSDLSKSFSTLVSVICRAFSNIKYPFSECQQTYSAETVMSSLTEFGIIHVEDYWWVKDIIHTITSFYCFNCPIVELNQGPAETSTSASAASSSGYTS